MHRYPKNYNRNMLINTGTAADQAWLHIAKGITSRANNISETTQSYYYLDGRGTAESEVTGQDVSVSFTGHRAVGDEAQDFILDEVLFDLDRREVEFIDYDDGIDIGGSTPPVNGYKGRATIQITDFGSGDAAARQNIGFTLKYNGKPVRGTVTKAEDGTYTWVDKV